MSVYAIWTIIIIRICHFLTLVFSVHIVISPPLDIDFIFYFVLLINFNIFMFVAKYSKIVNSAVKHMDRASCFCWAFPVLWSIFGR